jgi:hypothetical protein
MANADSQAPKPPGASGAQKRPKATVSSRYLLPLATAALVGACFLVYYLTYVQQRREYLLDRDYRVLATMGGQMSETLANQMSILTSYVDSFENSGFDETLPRLTLKPLQRTLGEPERPYEVEGNQIAFGRVSLGEKNAMIHSFAPRLNHVLIRHIDVKHRDKDQVSPGLIRRDGEWSFQLAAIDKDGDHEASGTISLQDLSQSFSSSISEGTFEDVLIAIDGGTHDREIVFQKQRIGPHFSYVTDLVKNAGRPNATPGGAAKDGNLSPGSADSAREGAGQLVETDLAGVPYLIFLEPVTVDLNPNQNGKDQQTQRLTLVGLVPSGHFRWQSLAISYRAVTLFSSLFLLLCLITPILKICFLNERGRLLRREIVLLPLLFATIAGVLTSICLQTIYFNLRDDSTDMELQNLSRQMQENIKGEITTMRDQLVAACSEIVREDIDDLSSPHLIIRTDVMKPAPEAFSPLFPNPATYPYFNNIFWTDPNGIQIVKWSATSSTTPLIDVSRLSFFRNLDTDNRYFFLDETKSFRFDSLLPPNQDSYVGVLGMRTSDCAAGRPQPDQGKYAFLTARPMSLIDPILPLGFGFALVDDTGQVLFHSYKYRNNRENILKETGYDRELTASLYGHSNEDTFSLDYRGNEVRARVVPVSGVGQSSWSLIVFKDARYSQTYALEVLTMAGALLFGYIGIPAVIVFLFYMFSRPLYVPGWLWPSRAAWRIYRFQIVAGAAMLVLSAALIFLRPIEESLYAAAASGYLTLIIVVERLCTISPHLSARQFSRWFARWPRLRWWRFRSGSIGGGVFLSG